ncbi:uncharacterized protein LOC114306874 [Camellia sinensis]|uniref:uncharacterized protein LOC114306874 n=1 Tax=Camellia sinensis TaxID=4442 RepID=UPI0010358321|nr:uncharacterized protein LOC114306874 [Camellia sinensis]
MTQPPSFTSPSHPTHVCLLKKAFYGLKQAPRAWYSTFSSFLLSQGFLNSQCDNSLFIQRTSSTVTLLLVNVDDILVTGNSSSHIQSLLAQMHTAFAMKELGDISYFLGISIQAYGDSYFLSQHKYASDILIKAGMTTCKPYNSPMSIKPSLGPDSALPFNQPELYRSVVGALQYLTITRPDLSFSGNQACKHMHAPTNAHFAAVKRLLRFVKGTLAHGRTFSPSSFELQAFSDSNWAGDALDRRSSSGYCVYLGSNLISWSAKKQPTVSRSSTEAEYRSLAHTTAELTWLTMLLRELQLHSPIPPILWCDNLSAIALASNPIVDIFTKPLSVSRFHYLQAKLLVSPSPISLPEGDKDSSAEATATASASAAASDMATSTFKNKASTAVPYSQLGIG